MTVDELRQILAPLDGSLMVVMSKDAEGNDYSPLTEVDPDCRYTAETTWFGKCHHPDDWESYPDAIPVVSLWPVN